MEYRIDVVDATNDKVIGTGLITAQGLLQQQRDFLVEEKRTTKAKYTQKEIEKCRKAENGVVNYDVHRPVGLVRLNIVKGRNIRSPELGLAGHVGCRVSLDLVRFMQEKQRKKALEVDHSMSAAHEFGSTAFAFGTEPVWDRMIKNDRAMRMSLLLPRLGTFFDSEEETNDVVRYTNFRPVGVLHGGYSGGGPIIGLTERHSWFGIYIRRGCTPAS